MYKYFFTIIFIPLWLQGQNFDRRFSKDFIEEMTNTLNVRFGLDNDIESFDFDENELSYSIVPNLNYKMRLAVNYRFLSFKLGYTPTFFANADSDKKGKTKVFKIGGDVFLNNWLQTLEYSKTQGYYISDIKIGNDYLPGYDDYIILPKLKSVIVGSITRYRFNEKYSLKSLINQTEIQRKSAGTFMPSFILKYNKISDSSINETFNIFDAAITAGYYYNFVINQRWFVNAGFAPGLGYEYSRRISEADMVNKTTENSALVTILLLDFGMGYNSKDFFGGFNFNGNFLNRDENPLVDFNTSRSFFQMYIGYRFKAPNFLKNAVDSIEYNTP
ncbi:DUF4421 family protein [Namhaeicola litoreus]|uniref:DUF4421 family protein n=1 Tax=Namhaeicola litoreus TaxID=1052145 RepID=A0ABW3Y4N2_9FLAO